MSDIDKIKIGGTDYTISVAPLGHLDNDTTNGFVSGDNASVNASTAYETPSAITTTQDHKTIFSCITKMIKNVRILIKQMGNVNRVATTGQTGQVKIGSGISVSSGTISIATATIGNMLYPVGSIYLSVNSTSPATLFGGNWTQIDPGYVLATTKSGSTITRYGTATGIHSGVDAITIKKANIPEHNHTASVTGAGHTHTAEVSSAGGHTHSGSTSKSGAHQHTYYYTKRTAIPNNSYNEKFRIGQEGGNYYYPEGTGSDDPRPTVKTSSSEGEHTHSYTTTSAGSHTHTTTIKSTTPSIQVSTGNWGTASPSSISVIPHTYNIYAWRRTALA